MSALAARFNAIFGADMAGPFAALAAVLIFFGFASPQFLTGNNLLNIVYQNATIGIAASAVTFTIIAGNFDLSLGSIFALSEVLGAWAAVHWGVAWCFPVTIGSGAVMGLINGLLVTKLRVNAFLATLASGLSFGGIAVGVTHGGLLITPASSAFTFIGQHKAGGLHIYMSAHALLVRRGMAHGPLSRPGADSEPYGRFAFRARRRPSVRRFRVGHAC